jgi:hypothetical protein
LRTELAIVISWITISQVCWNDNKFWLGFKRPQRISHRLSIILTSNCCKQIKDRKDILSSTINLQKTFGEILSRITEDLLNWLLQGFWGSFSGSWGSSQKLLIKIL